MDEQKPNDGQEADSTVAESASTNTGQVMDVTAPTKQIDVTESASDSGAEPSVPDASLGNPGEEPAVASDSSESFSSSDSESTESFTVPSAESFTETPPAAEVETSEPVSEPVADVATTSVENTVSETPAPETLPESVSTDTAPADVHPASAQVPSHKKGAPIVAIIAAVVIAVAIAGMVIFMYLKNKNGDIKRADTESSATVVKKPQASAADVDAASQTIDTGLQKTDDNKDFPTASLSDTSLGL